MEERCKKRGEKVEEQGDQWETSTSSVTADERKRELRDIHNYKREDRNNLSSTGNDINMQMADKEIDRTYMTRHLNCRQIGERLN